MTTATEIRALQQANVLNKRSALNHLRKTYWAVVVLYNWVIYECDADGESALHEVIGPVEKEKEST